MRSDDDRLTSVMEAGRVALMRADWGEARTQFEAAVELAESVEAYAGIGVAARGQLDLPAAFRAHERGYLLAREVHDDRGSARLALELAIDARVTGATAQAAGWLARAERILDTLPVCGEHGMLAYLRAGRALNADHDPRAARTFAARSVEVARLTGSVDAEMLSLALEGLAWVADGFVDEGMRRLDEATAAAVAGEVAVAQFVQLICCHMIDACRRVRDFDRVAEWCERVQQIAPRYGDTELFAICRIQYGDVLLWRGAWTEAEETLTAACRAVANSGGTALDGLVRLAELRRRQGRVVESEALIEQAESHALADVVRAAVCFDRGEPLAAAEYLERFLRRVGGADRFERVVALELLVRSRLALDDRSGATIAADELDATAAALGTPPLRAAALLSRARIAAADDAETARAAFEDAADLFDASGARYDAAQARLELAVVLRSLGRDDLATRAEQRARDELAHLGVPVRADTRRPAALPHALSGRELEVLRLLAQGLSNEEIARLLVLSVRTVERHVANLYAKIGVSGRTARAAATAFSLAHGL